MKFLSLLLKQHIYEKFGPSALAVWTTYHAMTEKTILAQDDTFYIAYFILNGSIPYKMDIIVQKIWH